MFFCILYYPAYEKTVSTNSCKNVKAERVLLPCLPFPHCSSRAEDEVRLIM